MGFLIVDKNTGDVIFDKIYTTEGRADAVLRKSNLLGKSEWVVVPMPDSSIIKSVANGGSFSVVVNGGFFEPKMDREFILVDRSIGRRKYYVKSYEYGGTIGMTSDKDEARRFSRLDAERIAERNDMEAEEV